MIAFFGINIAIGMVRLPEISNYWKQSGVMEASWFQSLFTRERFYDILKYLHLTDNKKTPEKTDLNYKLHKLGGIIEMLNASFKSGYTPCQQITIDEQMIGTEARISFLQYMTKKSKTFIVKLWAMYEATSGYCLCFQLYKGKSDTGQEHGLSYRVVLNLMDGYTNKNHHLYVDNFYASPKLLLDLEAKCTFCCGTVRIDHSQFSQRFKSTLLKNRKMVAIHWFHKYDVFVISLIHGTRNVEVTPREDFYYFYHIYYLLYFIADLNYYILS